MAREWIEYTGEPFPERNQILVTLYPFGQIVLNRFAFEAMGRPEAVIPLFDTKADEIGLKPASANHPNSFRVKRKSESDNCAIRLKPFCQHHDICPDHTVRFRDPAIEDGILVLDPSKTTKANRPKRGKSKPRR